MSIEPVRYHAIKAGGKRELAATITAVIAAATILGTITHYYNPNTTTPINDDNPAYPLTGHWEQNNGNPTAICDPTSAQAWPDGMGGVTLEVRMPGPGTIDVRLDGNNRNGGLPIHMVQQLTQREVGANFDARLGNPTGWISITANNKHDTGSCNVLPRRN